MRSYVQRSALLIGLLAAALGIRLAAGFWWQNRIGEGVKFGFADSESYWALGKTIAQGEPYQFGDEDARVFRTPGYPLLLAGLFCLGGEDPPVMWARALSAMLGVAAVGGVACLASQLFDRRTAIIAAAMAAVYPGAIAMSVFVLSEAAFCPLMLLQLILWTAAWRCENPRHRTVLLFGAGLAAGAATLVRPSWLLFTPFALATAIAFSRHRVRHAWMGAVMLVGLALVMTPWWIRNAMVTGRFVPTTLQVGASLYDGLSPQATGGSDMAEANRVRDRLRAAEPDRAPPPVEPFESRADRHLRGRALQWAWRNPVSAVRLAGVKFVRLWNVWPNERGLRTWTLGLIVMTTYVPLLLLGAWGAWRFARQDWPYWLCVLPAGYLTLLHMVFVSSIRYRQPAMLAVIVLAAAAVTLAKPRSQALLGNAKAR